MEKNYEFITEYSIGNKKYSDTILAPSLEAAQEIIKAKKETEKYFGNNLKPILLRRKI